MKELLKTDGICQSYTQMKMGPVFLTHSVYNVNSQGNWTGHDLRKGIATA